MKELRVIFLGAFFFSVHVALLAYVNSSVLSDIVGTNRVGIVYTIASVLSLIVVLGAPHILERLGNRKTITRTLLTSALLLLGVSFFTGIATIGAFILYFSLNALVLYCIDIFIEHYSKESSTGNIRGIYLVISNIGWVIAPTLSGVIEAAFGFKTLYLVASIAVAIAGILFWYTQRRFVDSLYKKSHLLDGLRTLKHNRNIRIITLLNLTLQLFFVMMVIYSPLYFIQVIGFSWQQLGILLSIMLLPFILFPYPAGRIADKYLGEKELLIGGFLLSAVAVLFLIEVNVPNFWYFAIVLFATRIGASVIEVMCESYFFKQVSDQDTGIISTYRNMLPVAYIIGPLIGATFFSMGSYGFVFSAASGMLVVAALGTLFLKDTR